MSNVDPITIGDVILNSNADRVVTYTERANEYRIELGGGEVWVIQDPDYVDIDALDKYRKEVNSAGDVIKWHLGHRNPNFLEKAFQKSEDAIKKAMQVTMDKICGSQQSTGGGSCNYYMAFVDKPTTSPEPYAVECNDLIESLGLTWQEANIVKEVFRTANERTHNNGKEGNTPKRAAEKVLFFAIRNAVKNGVDIHKMIEDVNCE